MNELVNLKKLFKNYLELNRKIVRLQSIVVVPAKVTGGIPINDVDIEEDFIYFCFTKFTKTMNAIEVLIEEKLYEDALILLRSNYECLINAKAVVFSPETLESFVQYKLGLVNNERYRKLKGNKIENIETGEELNYVDKIYDIAKNAQEENSYKYLYKYLCEITHCNFVTSGYYRNGVVYTYANVNEIALYNVLLWSVYINYKFYNCLIEDDIFDIDELEDEVSDILNEDFLVIIEEFEKIIFNIEKSNMDDKEIQILNLEKLKRSLLSFIEDEE